MSARPSAKSAEDQAEDDRSFLDRMLREHAHKLQHVVGAFTHDIEGHKPIHPEYVARILDDVAADDTIFTVDTGMCNVWAARYVTPPHIPAQQVEGFALATIRIVLQGGVGRMLQMAESNVRNIPIP